MVRGPARAEIHRLGAFMPPATPNVDAPARTVSPGRVSCGAVVATETLGGLVPMMVSFERTSAEDPGNRNTPSSPRFPFRVALREPPPYDTDATPPNGPAIGVDKREACPRDADWPLRAVPLGGDPDQRATRQATLQSVRLCRCLG